MEEEYEVQEKDYMRYVDKTPFLIYISISIVAIILCTMVWPKLFIYVTVPVAMANFVGAPKQDRIMLSIVNFVLVFLGSMRFRNNKV